MGLVHPLRLCSVDADDRRLEQPDTHAGGNRDYQRSTPNTRRSTAASSDVLRVFLTYIEAYPAPRM